MSGALGHLGAAARLASINASLKPLIFYHFCTAVGFAQSGVTYRFLGDVEISRSLWS